MYIRVNPLDNVAIIVHPDGAARRTRSSLAESPLANASPNPTKSLLRTFEPGEPILRYGQTIGYANRAISAGSWVREDLLDMPLPPPLDQLPLCHRGSPAPGRSLATPSKAIAIPMAASERAIFSGLRPPFSASRPLWNTPRAASGAELLPRFPNVDDVVAVTHSYGCGVAINAPGAADPISTLRHISLHANIGGATSGRQPRLRKNAARALFGNDFPVLGESNVIRLQDHRGFAEMVALIMEAAEKRLADSQSPPPRNLPRLRSHRRPAMRRQRRVLRRHLQSRRGLCRRSAGARRRHRNVLRSHRGARCHPSAHAARRHSRSGPRS